MEKVREIKYTVLYEGVKHGCGIMEFYAPNLIWLARLCGFNYSCIHGVLEPAWALLQVRQHLCYHS
jgi:hypothetical protein